MPKNLYILGAGGVGREIVAVVKYFFPEFGVEGFIDDGQPVGTMVNGIEILGGITWLMDNDPDAAVIIAIGNPKVRKKIIEKLSAGNFLYPTILHPNVNIHDKERVTIGKGCYIADGCIFTTDITVSDFCFINTSCSFQHDSVIGKNCVLMPGARITSGARLGENCYIGANCAIMTAIEIEDNSIIKESMM